MQEVLYATANRGATHITILIQEVVLEVFTIRMVDLVQAIRVVQVIHIVMVTMVIMVALLVV